jgi:hypothetical protein
VHSVGTVELGGRALGEANVLDLACRKLSKSALFLDKLLDTSMSQPTAPSWTNDFSTAMVSSIGVEGSMRCM